MRLLDRVPRPPLSKFIRRLWYFEGYPAVHAKERILPSGTMEIVINLKEDATRVYDPRNPQKCLHSRGVAVSGVLTGYGIIDTDETMHVMGVHFAPGGAFPFFSLPICELQDVHVSLDELWGPQANSLRDRILEAPTVEEKFDVLERALLERMLSFEHHKSVEFALQEMHGRRPQTVSALVQKIGISSRRFIQIFSNQVGLTPKLFCRVLRFQRVVQQISSTDNLELADLALECGYFDQPHFIHDFKGFSGISPTEYLANRTMHLNHVPLAD
jgi:AraC-like DNA-binding protein